MAFTYDPNTDPGKVRLLIADTVDEGHVFEDDEVQAALDARETIYRAAGMLLRIVAVNKIKLAKRIKLLDIELDKRSVTKDLLDTAAALEEMDDSDVGTFAIAGMVTDTFGWRERMRKESLRGGE